MPVYQTPELPLCSQQGCSGLGHYRYTWPGRDEAHVCETHAKGLVNVAHAMGLHLQLILLRPET